jgi:hypothetical protein
MTCQDIRDLLPELLDARSPTRELPGPGGRPGPLADARAHLQHCPECRREFDALVRVASALDAVPVAQPSPRLRKSFQAMLEREKQIAAGAQGAVSASPKRSRARGAFWRWWLSPIAGCALLALGYLAGQQAGVPAAPAPTQPSVNDSTQRELVALRDQINQQRQQLDKMTTLVGYSILQQQQNPANERLRDVLSAARAEDVNDKVLDDLIQALTLDPSANVRLRALEALYPHAERATVRAGVLAALPREQNPLVQLELIDFVATAQDATAAAVLEQIFANESNNRSVREAAQLALTQF